MSLPLHSAVQTRQVLNLILRLREQGVVVVILTQSR